MTNNELYFVTEALQQTITNINEWRKDYHFSTKTGEWYHNTKNKEKGEILQWFEL